MQHHGLKQVLICATLIAFASQADAQPTTADTSANAVYSGCKAFAQGQPTTNAQLAMLGNFCSGVLHGLAGVSQYVTPPEWHSCTPPNSDAAQLARVVIRFLDEHPERMHEDFRRLALEAFHQAWPCN